MPSKGATAGKRTRAGSTARERPVVYQFRVGLREISPEPWRRIQVPERYSMWDLHVAIQDSMGWLDCHLHEFEFPLPRSVLRIGLPDEDAQYEILPGWNCRISEFFARPGKSAKYVYDFGDGWVHDVLLEGIVLGELDTVYPACVAGAGACPPEDVGGSTGYEHLLEILRDPRHAEHAAMTHWANEQVRYPPFDPTVFDVRKVEFDSPRSRWRRMSL